MRLNCIRSEYGALCFDARQSIAYYQEKVTSHNGRERGTKSGTDLIYFWYNKAKRAYLKAPNREYYEYLWSVYRKLTK